MRDNQSNSRASFFLLLLPHPPPPHPPLTPPHFFLFLLLNDTSSKCAGSPEEKEGKKKKKKKEEKDEKVAPWHLLPEMVVTGRMAQQRAKPQGKPRQTGAEKLCALSDRRSSLYMRLIRDLRRPTACVRERQGRPLGPRIPPPLTTPLPLSPGLSTLGPSKRL